MTLREEIRTVKCYGIDNIDSVNYEELDITETGSEKEC